MYDFNWKQLQTSKRLKVMNAPPGSARAPDTRSGRVCSPRWRSERCPPRTTPPSPYWTPCSPPPARSSAGGNACNEAQGRQQGMMGNHHGTFQAHTFTLMSCCDPTLTMYLLLGENATQDTPYWCSSSSHTCVPADTSHTRTAGRWPLWGTTAPLARATTDRNRTCDWPTLTSPVTRNRPSDENDSVLMVFLNMTQHSSFK